jgi:PAS domain S-box-containing protein
VLGCSTGQEAYSLAMAFVEAAENAPRLPKLQVFATDLNDALLDKARRGLYAKGLVDDVSPERLRRFFVEEEGGYRVVRSLRERVVFARQNLISDPPFSRMDLISCRNLLIYLEPILQKKVLPTFHYALKPEGLLFLGASESIGGFTNLFEAMYKKHKIYSRKGATTPALHLPGKRGDEPQRPLAPLPMGPGEAPVGLRAELDAQREADRITVNRIAPPGVLIDAELQIVQFRGPTGAYLEPPAGKVSFDVLKMAREGLMLPLHAAINQAKKENKAVRRENVRVESNGKMVNVEVIPLKNLRERCFLIVFEEAGQVGDAADTAPLPTPRPAHKESRRVAELERESSEMRDYLQSIQEQYEAANEELQASSEEVQSANEELQSINEELETSKEELESANEELTTVNEEMANRNVELNRLNNDLVNLQTSSKLAVVLVGRDLIIRRFSPQAEKQFDLLATDVGRPISHIRHNLVFADAAGSPSDLERLGAEVIASVREQEHEVRDKGGRWYSLRVRPYMTLDNKVDGAVLVLVDIDALKCAEQAAAAARDYAENTVETVREPLLVLDKELRVEGANRSFYRAFRVAPSDTICWFIYDLGNRQWDIPRLRELLGEVLAESTSIDDFQVEHDFERLGRRTMLLNARRIHDPQRKGERILLCIEDITERRRAEHVERESEERYRTLFDSAPMAVFLCDRNAVIQQYNARAVELWGREPTCGVEKHCGSTRLWLPDGTLLPHDQSPMLDVLRTGVPAHNVEVFIERPDGSRLPVLVNFAAIKNARGEVTGAITSFIDITERKRAEEELRQAEKRLRFVMDSMPQKIFTAKPNGDVDYFNLQWTEFTGLPFEQIGDWGWTQFIHADDVAENVRIWQHSIDTGEPFLFEHRFRRADGEYRWHISRALPMRDAQDRIVMWIGSSTDVHEQQQTANKLQQLAADLSEADRRKNEFLAMLAHELRNPLAPIRNALQVVRLTGDNGETVHSAFEMMERQIGQMGRLVDDLLDVSRISRGKIELRKERVELASIVHHAVEACRPAMECAKHELSVMLPPQPVYLHGDPMRVAQVIGNLLNNACKFTDQGGLIWQRGEWGGRRHPSARHRHRHPTRPASAYLRDIRAGRYFAGAVGKRVRHRPDTREKRGGNARRLGRGLQCRCRSGERIRGASAATE